MGLIDAAKAYASDPDAAGAQRALLDEVVQAMQVEMVRLAARTALRSPELDDVTQLVWTRLFLKVLRLTASGRLDASRSEGAIRAYLSRILRNEFIDVAQSVYSSETQTAALEHVLAAPEVAEDVEQAADLDRARSELQSAIERLAPPDRNIIDLRLYAGLTYKQAADRLRITEQTARVRFHRALARLRQDFLAHRGVE